MTATDAPECPQHPGLDHCSGCIEESNEGYNDAAFTFDDEKYPCCCRSDEARHA
jgi:hypothetical protein